MVSDVSFISDKTMMTYSRESIKMKSKKLKNYLIPLYKQNSLNRSRINFPNLPFRNLLTSCNKDA